MFDGLVITDAEALEPRIQPLPENPHQIVFERNVEARLARVALTARTAAKLVIDPARFPTLGAEHVQAPGSDHLLSRGVDFRAQLGGDLFDGLGVFLVLDRFSDGKVEVTAELDVGPAPGHGCGDGDRARRPGLRDGQRLALVLPRRQDVVGDPGLGQRRGKHLRALDRRRTEQHRLALGVGLADVFEDGFGLLLGEAIDLVVVVFANHRLVGRHGGHGHVVNGLEFRCFGQRGTRHPSDLVVLSEEILVGDGRNGRRFRLDRQPFFRFQRLMPAIAQTAAGLGTARELVDQHDLVTLHHVLLIADEQAVSPYRRHDVVQQPDVLRLVQPAVSLQQPALAQHFLKLRHAFFGQLDVAGLFIDGEGVVGHFLRDQVGGAEDVGHIHRRAGHDQRGPGFVDQHRISLVDDDEVEAALEHIGAGGLHLVAQVVKADLGRDRIGNVGRVAAALSVLQLGGGHNAAIQPHGAGDVTGAHPQRLVQLAHVGRVAHH